MKFKKVLCGFIIVSMMGALTGCFNRIPGKIWKNPNIEDVCLFTDVIIGTDSLEEWNENNVITSVEWQKLKLTEEHSKKYPSLSKTFDNYNKERETEAKTLMNEFKPLAEEMEGGEFNPAYCQAETKVYIQRADNHIVSFLENSYKHTGGVHPDHFVNGVNFDIYTGNKVVLKDVLTDTEKLPDILEKKITEKYTEVAFPDLKDKLSKYKTDDFTWTIDYQGMTFWFSPYEIASYPVGTLSVKIWFEEFLDMFNKEYLVAPENYVITLPVGFDIEFDLVANDGEKDIVCAEKTLDRYGSYNMLTVTVNGKTFTDEVNYAYDFDVYLAHMGDKNYIYSDSFSDNDYHMFCTWDINGNSPKMIQELHGTEIDYEYIEEGHETGTVYKGVFNNPDNFNLETRFDILGTRGGVATYEIDKSNGTPQLINEVYTFNYGEEVRTSVILEAKVLPDMNKTEIPAETVLLPYQTDGKTFVDLKTDNGEVVRLSIDISDWPRTVNGIPEDECFENLMYAG